MKAHPRVPAIFPVDRVVYNEFIEKCEEKKIAHSRVLRMLVDKWLDGEIVL